MSTTLCGVSLTRKAYCSAEAGYSESKPSGRGARAKRTTREWQADSKKGCFKEAAAKHGFAGGKRVDCRRQFKKVLSGLLLMEKIFTINGSNIFL